MSVVVQHKSTITPDIVISETAKAHILSCLKNEKKYKGIRFSVKKTGCSGLSYLIDYIDIINEEDVTTPLNDDAVICIDKKSYPYLKGMHVDYVKQGLNYKFIFKNPNQTGQCGCGESFTVE